MNAPIIFFEKEIYDGALKFWFGAFALFLLTAAIHLLPLKIRRLLQTALITLFALLFVANIFLLQTFSVPLSFDTLQILLGTNFNEAKEFLQEYVLNFKVLGGLAAFIFLLAALSLGLKKFFATRTEERLKRLSIDLLIILLVPIFFKLYIVAKFLLILANDLFLSTTPWLAARQTYELVRSAPIGSEDKIFAEMDKQLESEKILVDDSNIPFVIFVLGEATDRNHMQLYGYRLATTPRLNERYERGEIFRFTDTIACANNTAPAMARIFTFAEKRSRKTIGTSRQIFLISCAARIITRSGCRIKVRSACGEILTDIFPRAVMKNFLSSPKTNFKSSGRLTACSFPCSMNFLPPPPPKKIFT